MKSFLVIALLAAFIAVTFAHHGKYKKGGCRGGYEKDIPDCAAKRGGRHEGDAGHGFGGYGRRHESDAGHGYGGYGRRGHDEEEEDEHVYRFMVGEDFGAFAYLNEDGYSQGFYIDLIMAVCKKAGKKCAYLRDTFDHCWHAEGGKEFPGVGLLDEYYDACMGFLPSPDRLNSFNFTRAFSPNPKGGLLFRKGEENDHKNLTGLTIGFLEGWAISERCLKREYNITGDEEVFGEKFYHSHDELVDALLHKEVDAILSVDVYDDSSKAVASDGHWFECSSRGLSVMAHYFSDVIDWWNCAFSRMWLSGEFKELCEQGQKKHGDHGKLICSSSTNH